MWSQFPLSLFTSSSSSGTWPSCAQVFHVWYLEEKATMRDAKMALGSRTSWITLTSRRGSSTKGCNVSSWRTRTVLMAWCCLERQDSDARVKFSGPQRRVLQWYLGQERYNYGKYLSRSWTCEVLFAASRVPEVNDLPIMYLSATALIGNDTTMGDTLFLVQHNTLSHIKELDVGP